jgi:hypothetical protein
MRRFTLVLVGLLLGCGSNPKPVTSGHPGAAGTSPDASPPGDGASGGGAGGSPTGAAAGSMAGVAGSMTGAAGSPAGAPGTDGGGADGTDAASTDGPDAAPDAGPPGKLAHPSLAALRAEAVGGWAGGAVVADFNGDGRPDVAVANASTSSVSIFINQGGGDFSPASSYDVGGAGADWLLVSDLDGDRRPDLAVSVYDNTQNADLGTRTVVLLNVDNGVFGPPRKVADGGAIALADLDGDAKGDLVVAKGGNANVLLNDGKGMTFHAAGTYPVDFGINRAAVGDLDKDGKPDLVVSTFADGSMVQPQFDGSLVVLLAIGNGVFAKAKTYPLAMGAGDIEIADVSGDGVPDLIASESLRSGRNAALNILVNKGEGSFGDATPLEVGPLDPVPTYFVARDFDRDGKVDLAVTCGDNTPPRDLKIFRNLGGGSFGAPSLHSLAIDVGTLSVADLDGDGALDFVVPTRTDGHLGVLRGYAGGTFPRGPAFTSFPNTSNQGSGFAVGEMDGDGKLDLLIASTSRSTVGIFSNDGHGGFPGPLEFTATGARAVAAADLNGDGKTDFAAAASGVSVYLNKGAASFMAPMVLATRPPTAGTPEAIVAGDVNGDGAPDLITLDTPDLNDSPPIATPVSVLLNKRDGTFAAATSYAAPSLRARAGGLALADVNGDKAADLIVAAGKAVGVLLNKGDGTFLPSADLPATAASSVVAADLNGDGAPDLAYVDATVVTLRLNDGKGGFGPATAPLPPLAGGPTWSAVTAGDLDNDGKLDLVTFGDRQVGIAFGRGDGTFAGPVTYLDGAVAPDFGVLTADLSGDGKRDVALLSAKGFSVILNDGR